MFSRNSNVIWDRSHDERDVTIMEARTSSPTTSGGGTDPLIVVTADSHVGPRPAEDLTSYCPAKHRAAWDEWVKLAEEFRRLQGKYSPISKSKVKRRWLRNLATDGHWDPHARLRDMDFDGVAGEVIFHGSQNGHFFPFRLPGNDPKDFDILRMPRPEDPELAQVGVRMYNRWLADFVSVSPERHVGLAYLPVWDIDASIAEVEWAAENGLKGINFPSPQTYFPEYNKPVWAPFWSAAAAADMPLTTHIGTVLDVFDYTGPNGFAITNVESAIFGRRGVTWLLMSGVFARHPNLKLVLTELSGTWWSAAVAEYDSIWRGWREVIEETVPELPSHYFERNVFVGASFASRHEVEDAFDGSYSDNCMWGSDYPHTEGTYQFPESPEDGSNTKLALRHSFAGLERAKVEAMVGRTAIRVYGMDEHALSAVAKRINAPTWDEMNTSLREEEIPQDAGRLYNMAFRRNGVFD